MRRDDSLRTVATLSAAAFLVLTGPSMAMAAADPGGSHGNGGNSNSGKAGGNQGGASRGNSGGGGNSGPKSSVSGQTNNGNSSKSNANANGNGNGGPRNSFAPGAQSNSGSDNPAAAPTFTPADPPVPVVVAEQHTGTAPAGRSWWSSPGLAPPIVEVHVPAVPSEEGAADLLSAVHTGIPVWAAAEPVGVRGDLFGLAGLVLMPLVGLAVGYRQAKAVRDADLRIRP